MVPLSVVGTCHVPTGFVPMIQCKQLLQRTLIRHVPVVRHVSHGPGTRVTDSLHVASRCYASSRSSISGGVPLRLPSDDGATLPRGTCTCDINQVWFRTDTEVFPRAPIGTGRVQSARLLLLMGGDVASGAARIETRGNIRRSGCSATHNAVSYLIASSQNDDHVMISDSSRSAMVDACSGDGISNTSILSSEETDGESGDFIAIAQWKGETSWSKLGRTIATLAMAGAFVLLGGIGLHVSIPFSSWEALATEFGPGIPTGGPTAVIDTAGSIPPAKRATLATELAKFETETGWKLRVLTRFRPGEPPSEGDVLKFWRPDESTILIIEDVTSPNILNFNVGSKVQTKLPRQFFSELQSRFGNLFYVREEGEQRSLERVVEVIKQCLRTEKGCRFVPGLTDDLYFLTLATSVVGGAVFGFAARVPPSGQINYGWQWVLLFSPLWGILLFAFSIGPIVTRTSELEPLIKNLAAFSAAAVALYLTPIFGAPPSFDNGENDGDSLR